MTAIEMEMNLLRAAVQQFQRQVVLLKGQLADMKEDRLKRELTAKTN